MRLCYREGMTDQSISEYMAQIGSKGGKARLQKMTKAQRIAVGKKAAAASVVSRQAKAAQARWAKEKKG